MKILELFAGSRSFSKVAEKLGHQVYTTDYESFDKIDQVCDIFDFNIDKMLDEFGMPDVIWASPPCTYFSVSSIGYHWNKDHTPKTKQAELGIKIVQETNYIIKMLKPKYFYIENPRGKLRKLNIITQDGFLRRTVWYCQYGETRAKPTDIWTNDWMWIPRNPCHNGNKNCTMNQHQEVAEQALKELKLLMIKAKFQKNYVKKYYYQFN